MGNNKEAKREADRKARGNNGAIRNMHYEMEVEEVDVRPGDDILTNEDKAEIGVKDYVRYRMSPCFETD